jgi:hypothetical protein
MFGSSIGAPAVAYPSEKSDADYRAESDCHTLLEAEKIKKDKSRYAAAMKVVKAQRDAHDNVVAAHAASKKPDTDKDGY